LVEPEARSFPMSTLFNITDKKGNVLTIKIRRNFITDDTWQWTPVTPGRVKAATGVWHPAARYNPDKEESHDQLMCMYEYEEGKFCKVLRMSELFSWSVFFRDAGKGYLFSRGNVTMAAGEITWKCLE